MDDFQKQALTEHLTELRKCLIYSLLATVAGFALCYSYSKELGQLLFKPLYEAMPEGSSLIFTSYQEGFFLSKAFPGCRASPGQPSDLLPTLALCRPRPVSA